MALITCARCGVKEERHPLVKYCRVCKDIVMREQGERASAKAAAKKPKGFGIGAKPLLPH